MNSGDDHSDPRALRRRTRLAALTTLACSILLAAACAWALSKVYADHSKQTDRMLTLLEQRAKADSELATALFRFNQALDDLAKEARAAHRTGGVSAR